jgi:predicted O-methyltransferase YrrM
MLPLTSIERVVGRELADDVSVHLKAVASVDHNCTIFELVTLALLAKLVRPKRCFEIGTYDGRSVLAIAMNSRPDAEVFTLNLPPDYVENNPDKTDVDVLLSAKVRSGERFLSQPEGHRIKQLFGDSRSFDFSSYDRMQFIFIDGAHDEESVLSDSRNALKMIDPAGGIVAWHDATRYGVAPALQRLLGEGHAVQQVQGTEIAFLRFSGR